LQFKGGTRVLVRGGPFSGKEREFKRPKCRFGGTGNVVNGTFVRCTPHPYPPGVSEPNPEDKVV